MQWAARLDFFQLQAPLGLLDSQNRGGQRLAEQGDWAKAEQHIVGK
jgi:hypothetical protein